MNDKTRRRALLVAARAHFKDKDCALEHVRGKWRLRSLDESKGLMVWACGDTLDEIEAECVRLGVVLPLAKPHAL